MSKGKALIEQLKKFTAEKAKATKESIISAGVSNTGSETNTKMILRNIAKWGVPPAAAGAGVGLGAVGISTGITEAFGIQNDNAENTAKSIKKASGWAFALIVLTIIGIFILPKILKAVNKK